ncbi:formylglycine-generating enzyme family protein [Rhodovibrio sodomensis]|nr:SUMF1/EgtB/PvdO family nonheme iron enzyme [Rhodovibrio sodomensis]
MPSWTRPFPPLGRTARLANGLLAVGPVAVGLVAVGLLGLPSRAAEAQAPGPPTDRRIDPGAAPVSTAAQAAMVAIPAGTYPIGDPQGRRSARPAHDVTLTGFAIDRTEVTNAAFAEYLNALDLDVQRPFAATEAGPNNFADETRSQLLEDGPAQAPYPIVALDDPEARIGYRDGAFRAADGYADHPVAETTWRGARDYCRWRGARLPTEAEWEAAARGQQARRYPWGAAAPSDARVYAGYPSGQTAPVGSRPKGATPRGLQDMAGSLAEWTASLVRPYPYKADDGRNDPTAAGPRITRGGDYVFDTAPDQLTTYFRDGFSRAPRDGHRHIGFRCARDSG